MMIHTVAGYPESPLRGKVYSSSDALSPPDHAAMVQFSEGIRKMMKLSEVFDKRDESFVVKEDIRKSKYFSCSESGLLQFVRSALLLSLEKSTRYRLNLARDHVTFVEYTPGGFFDWHNDFEKITINSNVNTLEMHLLYCINGCDEGGELQIESAGVFKEACTAGGLVMFDKLMKHRALEVVKGTKLVMLVDVLVSDPNYPATQPEFHVRAFFENPEQLVMSSYLMENAKQLYRAMSVEQRKLVKAFIFYENDEFCAFLDGTGIRYHRRQGGYRGEPFDVVCYKSLWEIMEAYREDIVIREDTTGLEAGKKMIRSWGLAPLAVHVDTDYLENLSVEQLHCVEDKGRSEVASSLRDQLASKVSMTYHCNEELFPDTQVS